MIVSEPEKGECTLWGLWEIKNCANWMSSKSKILIKNFVKIGELVQTLK
jgi:hypothetical protein